MTTGIPIQMTSEAVNQTEATPRRRPGSGRRGGEVEPRAADNHRQGFVPADRASCSIRPKSNVSALVELVIDATLCGRWRRPGRRPPRLRPAHGLGLLRALGAKRAARSRRDGSRLATVAAESGAAIGELPEGV
jgi:hypothetical protein